jgi:hypothetical protein
MGCVNFAPRITKRSRATGKDGATNGAGAAGGDAASGPGAGEQPGVQPSGGQPAGAAASGTQEGGAQSATVAQATSTPEKEAAEAHKCPHCGAPMADGQQWCTQCGEDSGGNFRKHAVWSSAGVLTVGSAILASAAAAAGVAALNQGSATEPPHRRLAVLPATTTSTVPPAPPPAAVSPGSPETLKTAHAPPASTPGATPATTHTPATPSTPAPASHGGTASNPSNTTSPASNSTQSSHSSTTSSSAGAEAPELQGLTASAYSLNAEYPKSELEGPENDPSRALEGRESGTAWIVQIKPGTAENVNVGLLVALGGATRVGSVEVHTTTPGFPLEIYGTTSSQPPSTLSAWTRLALTPKLKATATIKLGSTGTHMRYVLLWIPKVPAGTHHVALGEVALFAPTG